MGYKKVVFSSSLDRAYAEEDLYDAGFDEIEPSGNSSIIVFINKIDTYTEFLRVNGYKFTIED